MAHLALAPKQSLCCSMCSPSLLRLRLARHLLSHHFLSQHSFNARVGQRQTYLNA